MNETSDSLNCVLYVFDSSDYPPAPPAPRSPRYEAHIREQQDLLRRYGKLPPAEESPPPAAPPGQA